MSKRLYFISYYFPPIGGPGTMRPYYFVKNLQDKFDSITVFSASNDEMYGLDKSYPEITNKRIKFIRFDNSGLALLKKIAGKIKLLPILNYVFFPWFWERQVPWSRKLFSRLKSEIEIAKPDIIYVTSGPFSQVMSVYKLCYKLNIPFVVDLRDPFSESPGRTWMSYRHHLYFKKKEKEILERSKKIIVATPGMKSDYIRMLQINPDKIEVILNGIHSFDPEKIIQKTIIPPGKKLDFVYTGSLIDWNGEFNAFINKKAVPFKFNTYNVNTRSLFLYVQALNKLTRDGVGHQVVFNIYGGSNLPYSKKLIEQNSLGNEIVFRGKVPFTELNAVYQNCDALVLLMEERVDGQGQSCFMSGKIYEYISSGKPVICIGTKNDATDLLDELSYPYLRWDNDPQSIADGLKEISEKGFSYTMNVEVFNRNISKCLRSNQAQQLLNILETV